jgi:N-acetylglucosamine kinase-like BadF-type ATPase
VRALGLALRAGDGRGEPTSLRESVPAHLGVRDAEAALTGIYTGAISYNRLFELARVLLDAAADGDAEARRAADDLADEVAAFVRAAVVRLDLEDEPVEVVLGGGIFDTRDSAFHDRVAAGIGAVAPRAVLVRLDAPPVLGAALIGLDAIGAPPEALESLRAALTTAPGES